MKGERQWRGKENRDAAVAPLPLLRFLVSQLETHTHTHKGISSSYPVIKKKKRNSFFNMDCLTRSKYQNAR